MSARWWAAAVILLPAVPGAAQEPAPGPGPDALWQITLKDGAIVWNLRLVDLVRDTMIFRRDTIIVRYPLAQVDELRLVRAGPHEIGPVAAGGRYAGAANGDADLVFALTLLDLPERRRVVEGILRARRSGTPP